MQTSVKTVLHTTSETKLDYCMKKRYEHDAGRKEYIWTVYMCTVFRLMINSCKIMQGSKSHAITQTIHTNLVGLFCDAGYLRPGKDDASLKATFHLTISMRGQRATGKIQRNNYHHGSCGPSLTGKTMSVFLIFTQGTHRNVKNR